MKWSVLISNYWASSSRCSWQDTVSYIVGNNLIRFVIVLMIIYEMGHTNFFIEWENPCELLQLVVIET